MKNEKCIYCGGILKFNSDRPAHVDCENEKNLINFDTYELPEKYKLYDRHKLEDMIIDDNCYMNGKECIFKENIPYILVLGQRAIGKSQYSKVMSKYNKGVQYYSAQKLEYLDMRIRKGAIKRIMIGEIE